jgi:hypothetical protein
MHGIMARVFSPIGQLAEAISVTPPGYAESRGKSTASMRFSRLKRTRTVHILRPANSRFRGDRCVHRFRQVIARPKTKSS